MRTPPPTLPTAPGRVLVMGAGSIGCWLGGRLQAAGAVVQFVGRPRMLAALAQHGLTLTDRDKGRTVLPADALRLHASVPADLAAAPNQTSGADLAAPDHAPGGGGPATPLLVLLCVKSGATRAAAAELAAHLPAGTPVLCMQNGLGNAAIAQAVAPQLTVLPAMVPYNVAELGPGHLHRGSAGQLAAQDHPTLQPWLALLAAAGLALDLHADLTAVQWGKLLLNLNNSVNALSGLPLRAQLLDRDLRVCTAALVAEALSVLRRAGIQPASLAPLPASWLPWMLRLPTPLFRLVAARMLRIDAQARSSMADDLARGRTTEVDAINGEVMRLATLARTMAPRNARMGELVRAWPEHKRPVKGRLLREALGI